MAPNDTLENLRRRLAVLERRLTTTVRVGTVDLVDREKCRVRVLFPASRAAASSAPTVPSRFLPVLVKQSIGNRDYWLPTEGDQVVVVFDDLGFGFVVGSFYSDAEEVPEGASAKGMRVTEFSDGARVEYSTEESRLRVVVGEMEIEITEDAIKLGGGSGATQSFVRGQDLVQAIQAHTHPTGVGPSGPPANASAFPGTLSSVIKGR